MSKPMSRSEFEHAKETLGWNYPEMAKALGVSLRTPFRWASGERPCKGPQARLVRLLVQLRLTVSATKFEQIVQELRR